VLLSNNKTTTNNDNYDAGIESSNSNGREIEQLEELPLQNSFKSHTIHDAEDIEHNKCYESIRPSNLASLSLFSFIASFSILVMLSLSARNRVLERLKENKQYNK
jgi:hypothetical protein